MGQVALKVQPLVKVLPRTFKASFMFQRTIRGVALCNQAAIHLNYELKWVQYRFESYHLWYGVNI